MDQNKQERLKQLIESGRTDLFYSWKTWKHIRDQVLRIDRYECQICKSKGRYRQAVIVHHVKHLKDRPDLAFSIKDPDTGERQLISVCKGCHEELHPESQKQFDIKKEPVTEERWD